MSHVKQETPTLPEHVVSLLLSFSVYDHVDLSFVWSFPFVFFSFEFGNTLLTFDIRRYFCLCFLTYKNRNKIKIQFVLFAGLEKPTFDNRCKIYELDPCDGYGKVCLVYRESKAGMCTHPTIANPTLSLYNITCHLYYVVNIYYTQYNV